MSAVEFSEAVDSVAALTVALKALGGEHLPLIPRDELGARCVSLQTARQQLDGIIAVTIAEAERAGVAVNAGQRTMAQYLASRTHSSPEAVRADTRLGLWIRQFAGLDPLTGAILVEQLGQEENALLGEDQENNAIRTATQRRAAAFASLLERGAGRTEATSKPLVHVIMSLSVLQNALAQLAKEPHEQDFVSVLDPNDPDGRCELSDGTPLHPKYALVLLMQARIRRQVLEAKNNTLDASLPTRLFPTWMKHIKLVDTRGQCETAGCDAAVHWLQADHHKPRSKQGETALHNLTMLCAPDNKAKSDGPPLAERRPTTSSQTGRTVNSNR